MSAPACAVRNLTWRPSGRVVARIAGIGALALTAACATAGAARSPAAESRSPAAVHSSEARASIVQTGELRAQLAGGASVLDVRFDIGAYLKSHIPGAVYLNTETLRASDGGVPNLLLPGSSYSAIFSRLGVRADRPVVIYGSGEGRNIDATYVAWILVGLGHPAVRVLDGGFAKWATEGHPTVRTYPRVARASWSEARFAPAHATLDDVRRAMGRPGTVIVDARVAEQYTGEAGAQMRRGHIPGAVSHYWQDDLTSGDFARVWRPRDELRASYAAQGITPDKDIVVYCNGGLESSHVYFTLHHLLGYPRVRVYDGSWTEWAAREELPVETGPGRPVGGAAPRGAR